MSRARDSQRAAFWDADKILKPYQRELKTPKGLRSFIEKSRSREYLLRRYRSALTRPINTTFSDSLKRKYFEPSFWAIIVPPKDNCLWSDHAICRQIAYVILYRVDGRAAWHGREFCAIYLDVVRAMMGRAAYDLLKASFQKHGVRFTPKRARAMTADQRRAAGERLAAAREAKANA